MNTKTMRLPPRRCLTPNNNNNNDNNNCFNYNNNNNINKRKEREGFDTLQLSPQKPVASVTTAATTTTKLYKPIPNQVSNKPPAPSNQLIAGYLAHEYLTKGTLFGQAWDPAIAEAVPVSKKLKPSHKEEAEPKNNKNGNERRRYMEVSMLLKADGAYLPGIVNPTQLSRFLQSQI